MKSEPMKGRVARAIGVLCSGMGMSAAAFAGGTFNLWGIKTDYDLQATYAVAMRVEDQSDGIINSPSDPRIPLPEYLKVPASNNFDDGDRNFDQWSLINNRATLLGELLFKKSNYGAIIRGDVFYDDVYHRRNDNTSPDRVNKTGITNQFTSPARKVSGGRPRLLDTYAFVTFPFLDDGLLNLRVGQQVVAWGESLFFSGIALAQGPADGAAANVPGADVKGILLPVNQISLQAAYGDFTLLGQYKLAFKPTEVNPVGEYFSIADPLGPGAEFAYGIRNPFFLDNLSGANLLSDDLITSINTVAAVLGLPPAPGGIPPGLPGVNLPRTGIAFLNAPEYVNPQYAGKAHTSNFGQYGIGLKYQLTEETELGIYRLRYHNTVPTPEFTYGFSVLAPGDGTTPPITTEVLNLRTPVTYQAKNRAGINLSAVSFSSTFLGANIAGELIYREGIDVLVDVDGGLLGPLPTATAAKMLQVDLNAIYLIPPRYFWDSITLVADVGFIHVDEVTPVSGPDPAVTSTQLTYSRDASAYTVVAITAINNVFSGWDMQVPLAVQGVISGHSSLLGGFGSLGGNGDMRVSLGANITRLQRLSFGVAYNAYLGSGDYTDRPLADRDFVSFNMKYGF